MIVSLNSISVLRSPIQKNFGILLIGLLISLNVFAQENPPIPLEVAVSTSQFLNFGAFTVGNSGGTVSVDYDGTRSWTGEIGLLNFGPTVSPALFEVTAIPGSIIQIQSTPNIPLNGSNGGTILLNLDSYSLGQTFISTASPPFTTAVYIGGTLTMGNTAANPAGNYSGTFNVTFINQ
jgi:hypothetical protein